MQGSERLLQLFTLAQRKDLSLQVATHKKILAQFLQHLNAKEAQSKWQIVIVIIIIRASTIMLL